MLCRFGTEPEALTLSLGDGAAIIMTASCFPASGFRTKQLKGEPTLTYESVSHSVPDEAHCQQKSDLIEEDRVCVLAAIGEHTVPGKDNSHHKSLRDNQVANLGAL